MLKILILKQHYSNKCITKLNTLKYIQLEE